MVRTKRIRCLVTPLLVLIAAVDARSAFRASHEDPSRVKHFQAELDTKRGYWSPSSSSIDWCERNYVVTHYIAEFWNCLSSLSMSVLAGILFVRGLRNKLEHRFLLLSFSFGIVGLGSAYFHGTLTHWGQMADELPMVYSMIVWWYLLFHMNPLLNRSDDTLAILFSLLYGLLWTYVHSLQSFVLIFQGHFTLMVIGGILRLIFLSRQSQYRTSQIFYMVMFYAGLLIPASICWLVDQHFCERLNGHESGFNPQFHAWWHLLCALDCHLGIVCVEAMRLLSIKAHQNQQRYGTSLAQPFRPADHFRLLFSFGLPFVDYSSDSRTNRVKDHER